MPVFWAKRVGNVLAADGDESNAVFDKLPRGRSLRVDVTEPRNGGFHRKFWKLCAIIAEGIGEDAEFVERAFKVETGHFDIYKYAGRETMVLRSISFAKMDNLAFEQFFNKCCAVMYERWKIDPASVADLLVPQEDQKRR